MWIATSSPASAWTQPVNIILEILFDSPIGLLLTITQDITISHSDRIASTWAPSSKEPAVWNSD